MEIENIEDLLLRYSNGETDAEENVYVEAWLHQSEEHRVQLRRIQMLSMAADVRSNPGSSHTEQALQNLHRRMNRTTSGRTLWQVLQRVAAVLFLPLLGLSIWLYLLQSSETINMVEARTNPGMNTTLTLPDGSVVVLNSSSTLRYPEYFTADSREVTLCGEGYFTVMANPDKPFIVHTLKGSRVEVFGTEFNVDAYPEGHMVRTTLVTGKISFSYADDRVQRSITLRPGQQLSYNATDGHIDLQNVNVEVETAWKDGKLIFQKTPFEDILRMLGKRYNVHFILKNEQLKKHTFTGEFAGQHLSRVLEQFSLSSDIHFKYIKNASNQSEKQTIEVY